MMSKVSVKICGLSDPSHVAVAAQAGAAYVGFVFFEKSPRNVSLAQARGLALETPAGLAKVALTVDADNAMLDMLTDSVPLLSFLLRNACCTASAASSGWRVSAYAVAKATRW